MHLRKLFDEHASPTHCCKADVHGQMGPILKVVADSQKQVLQYKTLLMEEEMNPERDDAYDGKLEHIRQTFVSIERRHEVLTEAARGLAHDYRQLDRYLAKTKADLEEMASIRANASAKQ